MKKILKKPLWIALSAVFAVLLAAVIVGSSIADTYKRAINEYLGLQNFRMETVEADPNADNEYFKSEYVQKDEDGNIKYVTDEGSKYKHQLYDDEALHEADVEKGKQVQKEGTTILWNNSNGSTQGLPLAKGNKISLFSHSSVDWAKSGSGSGGTRNPLTSELKTRLTEVGFSVNSKLWDFYKSGKGSSYGRVDGESPNEVPWSVYTNEVTSSFKNYGDAAIVVLTRRSGERMSGYNINDVLRPGSIEGKTAKTISGDYFGISKEEKEMLDNLVSLKKSGTFKKIIILLNTAGGVNFNDFMAYRDDVDACVWTGQTGDYGLYEVANILVGDSIPSGHLPDTFVYNGKSAPAEVNGMSATYANASSFKFQNEEYQNYYIAYAEGIYVGYKYYETRYEDAVMESGNATSKKGAVNSKGNWKYGEEVAFPFGYGASYTTFSYSDFTATQNKDESYTVTVKVTNTGKVKGADAVQVYLQKPYTAYDKANGIEQASVNLCGFAKTKELAAGESQTVTIEVDASAFATYDSKTAKTYIREGGKKNTYYLTAAEDAHAAVNNILAAKGYTPGNSNNVMDAEGNKKLVESITFAKTDTETFAVSSETGNKITNRFDDVDWNKYENNGDNKITYLSRSDWAGTYPVSTAKLLLTSGLLEDLAYQQTVEQNPEDKMPTYGAEQVLSLIDVKGLDYDDPAWDTLLDQMTLKEQIDFIGNCYKGTQALESVVSPGTEVADGPLGLRKRYKTNATDKFSSSFSIAPIVAATYNRDLVYAVGVLKGEDSLHVGFSGVYGGGANIHRTQYGGRAYEYYSEDGYLSGVMCAMDTAGFQKSGNFVNIKHFLLNDVECSRWNGVAIWANEQSIREIYLEAYRRAVTEADAKGIMTSFTRMGSKWSGAHKGLITDVLRGEWGFDGFVISDCPYFEFMGLVEGLVAGNDCILYSLTDQRKQQYYDQADNPTVAQAIRTSTHRILYVVANSNAMNGYNSNTKIYPVTNWWQILLIGLQVLFGVLTAASITMLVLCFVKESPEETVTTDREAIE